MVELTGEVFAGGCVSAVQLEQVRQTVRTFSALSRRELAHTVCEHLGWHTPNGDNRVQSAIGLLERMEGLGLVTLPDRDHSKVRTSQRTVARTGDGDSGSPVEVSLRELMPVHVRPVGDPGGVRVFNELVDRYHYLGYRRPIGPHLRYFVTDREGRRLALVMFTYAAVAVRCRDEWIGWAGEGYRPHLERVIQNNRFVVLPWVRVRNLASKALSIVLRRLADDWQTRHGVRPVLAETYVDGRFAGSCYRASNWRHVGHTLGGRGRGKPKAVYVYPLDAGFRTILSGDVR